MVIQKQVSLIYTNSYYYIGHFSKFVHPGAKRIISSSSRSQLLTTAFINEDGKVAVIVMNQSNLKITYNLCIGHKCGRSKNSAAFNSDSGTLEGTHPF